MRVLAVAALLLFAGCSTYRPKVRYIEEEYAPYAKDGNSSLSGKAFLTLKSGEIKAGAAQPVYLVPVTSRSTEAFERGIARNRMVEPEEEPASEIVKKCNRTVQADRDGKFRFEKLPPGEYYVYCKIYYKRLNAGTADGVDIAYSKVTLSEGEEKSIAVTR